MTTDATHPPGWLTLSEQLGYPIITNLKASVLLERGLPVLNDGIYISTVGGKWAIPKHLEWNFSILGFRDDVTPDGPEFKGKYLVQKGNEGIFVVAPENGIHLEMMRFTRARDYVGILGAGSINFFPDDIEVSGYSVGLSRGKDKFGPRFDHLDRMAILKHFQMPYEHLEDADWREL